MKLATIALASAFVLSTTVALATTTSHHHKHTSGVRTHQGTVGMGSGGQYGRAGAANGAVGTPAAGWYGPRGGLVGGSDSGVDRPTR
jgi:hypothetical protein